MGKTLKPTKKPRPLSGIALDMARGLAKKSPYISLIKENTARDPYKVEIGGQRCDPYRVGVAFNITHPALFQALKKILRAGAKHKDAKQDIAEAIQSLQRWQQMQDEDAAS